MPSGLRQMWHQHKEVEKIAGHNGYGLFDESSIHALHWMPHSIRSLPCPVILSRGFRVEDRPAPDMFLDPCARV